MLNLLKQLGNIVYQGARVTGKSVYKSVKDEIQASSELARIRNESRPIDRGYDKKGGLSLEEAMKILSVDKLDQKQVRNRYEYLFNANKKAHGGSFYVQSKVVRAKERIDLEFS